MIRRPPRSTLFPTRRSSDLECGMRNAKWIERLSRGEMVTRDRTCIRDRKSTRLNSSHSQISYAVFCLKKKNHRQKPLDDQRLKGLPCHDVIEVGLLCDSRVA